MSEWHEDWLVAPVVAGIAFAGVGLMRRLIRWWGVGDPLDPSDWTDDDRVEDHYRWF